MAGVGLVGYSGSLIKDAVKQATLHLLSSPGRPNTIQGEEPELTKAVVGTVPVNSLVIFISIAQRCIFHLVGPNFVCLFTNHHHHCRVLIPASTAAQFVVEGTLLHCV
jgi:hypothetical protein